MSIFVLRHASRERAGRSQWLRLRRRSIVIGSPILEDTGENRRAVGGVQESGTDLMRISSIQVGLTRFLGFLTLLILASGTIVTAAEDSRDLAGAWRFRIDRDDRGLAENWANAPLAGEDTVQLPGMMQAQGHGDPVAVNTPWPGEIVDRSWFTAPEYEKYRQPGNIKVPFWLQPERHYVGAASYQREVENRDSSLISTRLSRDLTLCLSGLRLRLAVFDGF